MNDIKNNNLSTLFAKLSSLTCIAIIGSFIIIINIGYLYGLMQPVRWPSLIYLFIAIVISAASKKWSIFILILIFPLLPDLHIQIENLRKPAVKYFIAYPGIDFINGFLIGTYIRSIYENKTLKFKIPEIPWPLQVFIVVILLSAILAISRNLWQSASEFNFNGLIYNLLRLKLIGPKSDYYPLTLVLIYIYSVLLFSIFYRLFSEFKNEKNNLEAILLGLFISATVGIFQAVTGFGLPITTSGYRTEILGFGAHGFQPDLHAFAAHMLLGAVGLYGLFFIKTTNKFKFYLISTQVVCWCALLLSKSRASLMFAIFFTALFVILFVYKSIKKTDNKLLYISIFLLICILAFYILLNSSVGSWIVDYYQQITKASSYDFNFINQLTRWRLEFHFAALRMWSEFPLWGLGLGEFYRQSSVLEFSNSDLMVRSGGENAHNYFLQTLTDTGLIGFACFALIFIYPIIKSKNRFKLLVPGMMIFSLFLGNVFSHSFIIKENIFLLSIILALYYTQVELKPLSEIPNVKKYICAIGFMVLIYYSYIEIKNSYFKTPFTYGFQCFRDNAKLHEGWTTGEYKFSIPENSRKIKIVIDSNLKVVDREIKNLKFEIINFSGVKKDFLIQKYISNDEIIISIELPDLVSYQESLFGIFRLQNCIVPLNLGANEDARHYGIRLKSINFQ